MELNGLGPDPSSPTSLGKVRINEGDAWYVYLSFLCHHSIGLNHLNSDLMYSHRPETRRVDVVDLDPYGTAAPFIDAAVQSIKDDGALSTPNPWKAHTNTF